MSPVLGIWASQGRVAGTSFESISTVTVGAGGASSIDFTSIPGTYTHLQIRGIARTNRSDNSETTFALRFNSDGGSNYAYHRLIGDGSSASASGAGSSSYAYLYAGAAGAQAGTNTFGASIWDILDYTSTAKNKTVRYLGGLDNNGSGRITLGSGLWLNNTTAISSIAITTDGSYNFTQYSTFALYGIRSA